MEGHSHVKENTTGQELGIKYPEILLSFPPNLMHALPIDEVPAGWLCQAEQGEENLGE